MKIRSLGAFIISAALAVSAQAQSSTTTVSPTTKSATQSNAQQSKTVVTHDATLQGDGSTTAPLGLAQPLNVTGAVNVSGDSTVNGNSTVTGTVTAGGGVKAITATGNAVEATGGNGSQLIGLNGAGVKSTGGTGSQTERGGSGVEAHGGKGGNGGTGVEAHGGDGLDATSFGGRGVEATGGVNSGTGVEAFGGANTFGFQGGIGVRGRGGDSNGATSGIGGVFAGGQATNGDGGAGIDVEGGSANGPGHISGAGIVVRPGTPFNGASSGPAATFAGDVDIESKVFIGGSLEVRGNLAKGSGSFKIDHPLDPENKFLSHSFVESPDMMNIYNGTITTDARGNATVTLPDWFEALNQDFRYQLTAIGTFAQAIVAKEIKGNRFMVKTSAPNVKVSWQVTGVRHDAYANLHRIVVEEPKGETERGFYLHPDAFHQPESKSIQAANAPRQKQGNAAIESTGEEAQQ